LKQTSRKNGEELAVEARVVSAKFEEEDES